MSAILQIVIANGLVALGIAAVAILLGRYTRWHRLTHFIWLLALAKLCIPALVEFPVSSAALPTIAPMADQEIVTAHAIVTDVAPVAGRNAHEFPDRHAKRPQAVIQHRETKRSPWWYLLAAWAVGSCALCVWMVTSHMKFLRSLALSEPGDSLRREIAEHAKAAGLRQPPRLQLTNRKVSPFVLASVHGALLVLPTWLLDRFSASQRRPLVLHEMIHLRRKDHLVRVFESAVLILFWWNPLAWFVSSRLRHVEELCCDLRVAQALPGQEAVYANALLDAAAIMSQSGKPLPALASGVIRSQALRERLETIFQGNATGRRSRKPVFAVAGLIALCLLLVGPRFANSRQEAGTQQPKITYSKPQIRYSLDR